MMLHKNNKRGFLLACLMLVLTGLSITTFAKNNLKSLKTNSSVEKLAEYDAFNFLLDVLNGSATTFKGKPILLTLERNESSALYLKSTKFINNYTEVQNNKFSLKSIVGSNTDYELDVESNNDTLFALLTNNNDQVRDKKNLLLKSTDGNTWELYKSFPAEWELYDLEVSGTNLSVTCINCEDELKLSYIISNDSGRTWNKYSLPETASTSYFSGMANGKLYVVAQNRSAEDRKELVHEVMFSDLKTKRSGWSKSNTSSLNTLSKEENGSTVVYKFNDIEQLFDTEDYLIAEVSYLTEPNDEDEVFETKATWISRDNGLTWSYFSVSNLGNESVAELTKYGEKYHLVTSKYVDLPDFDNSNDGLDPFGLMMEFFKQQHYAYYTLTKEQMDSSEKLSLEPKFVLENGLGYNIDYKFTHKASYVDTVFVHNNNNELKLEFYRQHED